MFEICLIGNPNSGKSTLFNALTGANQKIGNYCGVTFESKEGKYKKDTNVKIVDLPGLYSFTGVAEEEKAVIAYLNHHKPNAIINIVDGTNLERNLRLTYALENLKIPVIIAVNMIDELNKNNVEFNAKNLEQAFGVSVVKISAKARIGLDELIIKARNAKNLIKTNKNKDEEVKTFIKRTTREVMAKKQLKSHELSFRTDKLILGKITGLPIFFGIITIIYYLTFKIGGCFSEIIDDAVTFAQDKTKLFMVDMGVNSLLIELFCNAVLKGIGTVLSFLPQILVLYFFMSLIEESGYASRIAFLLDGILTKIGLGGKSLLPLMLSCGCCVNGLEFCKTIDDKTQKTATIFLLPFMPCSAKTTVFAFFSGTVFGGNALISSSTYFISLLVIIFWGIIIKRFNRLGDNSGEFIMEMPTLRLPTLKNIGVVLISKIKDFIIKAGSVIFLVSVTTWLLLNFGFNGYVSGNVENSFLYLIGNIIKYVFYPLGFGSWQSSVAILSSIVAKEAVIEIFMVIGEDVSLIFPHGYNVFSFMVFILLSPPCVASISMAKKQLKSNKLLLLMILFQFCVAYLSCFVINVVGILLSLGIGVFFGLLALFCITFIIILSQKKLNKYKE